MRRTSSVAFRPPLGRHGSSPVSECRTILAAIALGGLLWCLPHGLDAQRTDVLVMNNGDEITGEIKSVARGRLTYKTDDMGTLSVKWDKVARLRTVHIQEVLLSNGRRLFGSLRDAEEEYRVVVGADTVRLADIVEMTPIEATFIERTNGYLDVGFTFAQANTAVTLTTGWEANYRGEIWGAGITGSNYYQEQEGSDPTTRNSIALFGQRFISGRRAVVAFFVAEQNDQLNLVLRTNYGGGARFRPLLTNHMEIGLMAGVLLNQEQFDSGDTNTASDGDATSVELMGTFAWDWFRYDSPKFDVDLDVSPFLGVTTLGRVRLQADVRTTYEVFSDFNVGLTVRESFDSDPPSEGAAKNDFTVTLTIGWSWS